VASAPPPGGGSNGLAIAALICGIASIVLCFVFAPGVAAIVLGAIGLGKAKQLGGKGKGQAIAGIVLGAVSLLAGIGTLVAINRGADEVEDLVDEFGGPADPDTFDVTVDNCELDEFGTATAEGLIINTSGRSRNYEVVVEFVRGDEVLDSGTTVMFDVGEGERDTWTVVGTVDESDDVECTVSGVNNVFN
jgi:hypothetical protein